MIKAGRTLAPALLFFGCRSPDVDDLYAEEFKEWEDLGAVSLMKAYSRAPEKSKGCKYVQHRMENEREELLKLWSRGAKMYVCGSRDVGKAVEDVVLKFATDEANETRKKEGREPATPEEMQKWWENARSERYATDVFD